MQASTYWFTRKIYPNPQHVEECIEALLDILNVQYCSETYLLYRQYSREMTNIYIIRWKLGPHYEKYKTVMEELREVVTPKESPWTRRGAAVRAWAAHRKQKLKSRVYIF